MLTVDLPAVDLVGRYDIDHVELVSVYPYTKTLPMVGMAAMCWAVNLVYLIDLPDDGRVMIWSLWISSIFLL